MVCSSVGDVPGKPEYLKLCDLINPGEIAIGEVHAATVQERFSNSNW